MKRGKKFMFVALVIAAAIATSMLFSACAERSDNLEDLVSSVRNMGAPIAYAARGINADMSDEDVDHVDELFSDASALHNAAGEDEHRYRYQRNRVHLREAVRQKLRRGISGSVRAAEEYQPRAGGHKADGNGNAYRKAEYKYYKRYVNHLFLPPKSAFPALIVSQRK